MATFPSRTRTIRSISLPVRSHPTTQRIEELLNKLKGLGTSVSPTTETICNCLNSLEELQKCMDDLLVRVISQHQGKWFDDYLEKSVNILDVCGTTRELVSQYKENVRDLQSLLRRRKGDSDGIDEMTSLTKKIKKDAKRVISTLKHVDRDTQAAEFLELDKEAVAVIRALKEATAVCILVFQMLLSFLSVPPLKPKQPKWSLVSKLINNARIEHKSMEKCITLETRLEILEAQLDSIEKGLEGTFRGMIKSRSLLLNVFSS